MKAPAAPVILTYQSHKRKAAGGTPMGRRSKTRRSAPQVSHFIPLQNSQLDYHLFSLLSWPSCLQPSNIEAQAAAVDSDSANPEEPISNPLEETVAGIGQVLGQTEV